MEQENGDVKPQDQKDEEEEEEEDGTFDETASFPELERTQTGRKTSIFKYYAFKEKGIRTWNAKLQGYSRYLVMLDKRNSTFNRAWRIEIFNEIPPLNSSLSQDIYRLDVWF